jgi:hypothetical protein
MIGHDGTPGKIRECKALESRCLNTTRKAPGFDKGARLGIGKLVRVDVADGADDGARQLVIVDLQLPQEVHGACEAAAQRSCQDTNGTSSTQGFR